MLSFEVLEEVFSTTTSMEDIVDESADTDLSVGSEDDALSWVSLRTRIDAVLDVEVSATQS